MKTLITTEAGYLRLQEQLQTALNAYDAVCATNADAKDAGDNAVWHDNFAYEQNQRDMHKWACRINELQTLLSKVRVIQVPAAPDKVQVGCLVTLEDMEENRQWVFEVAGYDDGDIRQGRVSYTSPLMQQLIDAAVGEEYELLLDGRIRCVAITAIKSARVKETDAD